MFGYLVESIIQIKQLDFVFFFFPLKCNEFWPFFHFWKKIPLYRSKSDSSRRWPIHHIVMPMVGMYAWSIYIYTHILKKIKNKIFFWVFGKAKTDPTSQGKPLTTWHPQVKLIGSRGTASSFTCTNTPLGLNFELTQLPHNTCVRWKDVWKVVRACLLFIIVLASY